MDRDIQNILHRLNMEKMRNQVIWYREARGEPDPRSYDEQLQQAEQKLIDSISAMREVPSQEQQDAAVQEVCSLLKTAKDVYTTIGIKVGTELAGQQLQHERQQSADKPDEQEDSSEYGYHHVSPEDCSVEHSTNFFERMEARASLQSLGEFIRDGGTRTRFFHKSFQERMDEANHKLEDKVSSLTKDKDAADNVHDAICDYDTTIIDIYFSLGMKVGAQLNAVLMGRFDRDN